MRCHGQRQSRAVPAWELRASSAAARLARPALLWLSLWSCGSAAADLNVGGEASVRHDSNVGNAQPDDDIVADTIVAARLSGFEVIPLASAYSVSVAGGLAGEIYHRLTGLNNASANASASLKRKWGLGAFAPWASAAISVGRQSYDDAYRNAWNTHATLSGGRRIDERLNLWAAYDFDRRTARAQEELVPGISGDAYSTTAHTLSAHAEYAVHERVSVSLALSARHGDVISTTEENPRIFYASTALAEDPAFGDEDYAYRITGNTYGVSVGVSVLPTRHSALSLSFSRFDTHADAGNDYRKSIPEISWSYRY